MSLELSRSYSGKVGPPCLIIPIGFVFKKWTVIKEATRSGRYRKFECRCACGSIQIVTLNSLRTSYRGKEGCVSCCSKAMSARKTKHGMYKTKIYRTWYAMRRRCDYPGMPSYEYYGGRGIRVCDRWQNSFDNFIADMGPRPDGYELDRIDVDGNYTPENCRWVTPQENHANRRISKKNRHKYIYALKENLCNSCIKKAENKYVDASTGEPE